MSFQVEESSRVSGCEELDSRISMSSLLLHNYGPYLGLLPLPPPTPLPTPPHPSDSPLPPPSQLQGPVSWRPTTVKWRQSSQSNRQSIIGTRQTEYHEALPSSANDEVRCNCMFATMATLHNTRFVECRWWNGGWTVKTVVT